MLAHSTSTCQLEEGTVEVGRAPSNPSHHLDTLRPALVQFWSPVQRHGVARQIRQRAGIGTGPGDMFTVYVGAR